MTCATVIEGPPVVAASDSRNEAPKKHRQSDAVSALAGFEESFGVIGLGASGGTLRRDQPARVHAGPVSSGYFVSVCR